MANSIQLTGVQTLTPPETRALLYLTVTMNDTTYEWSTFMPPGQTFDAFLEQRAPFIYAEITAKEAEWAALTPKTRLVDTGFGAPEEVPIAKEEIVRPDNPDYYAQRRDAYPAIGDQLDAIWKGVASLGLTPTPEIQQVLQQIQAVKAQYPKPTL